MHTIHLETVDSTNEYAKRLIAQGALSESLCIVAREQTAGKGTRGRSWSSPADAGIYMSLLNLDVADAPILASSLTTFTIAAGVACVEVLNEFAGIGVRLKPINDLVVDGRKLGGLLTEAIWEQGRLKAIITGLGLNVRRGLRLVDQGALPTVSLEELVEADQFRRLDMAELQRRLADGISQWSRFVVEGDPDRVQRAWARHKLPGSVLPLESSNSGYA